MKNLTIEICLGSSCHSKNSKALADIIIEYAKHKESIDIKGCLCKDLCLNGPVITINNKSYTDITKYNILQKIKEVEG